MAEPFQFDIHATDLKNRVEGAKEQLRELGGLVSQVVVQFRYGNITYEQAIAELDALERRFKKKFCVIFGLNES